MGRARMKSDKTTEEKGKMREVSMERSKVGTKENRTPGGLIFLNQNTIIINIIC